MNQQRLVHCKKLGKELPGMPFKPFPDELGQEIYDNVSMAAWQMWLQESPRYINTYHIDLQPTEKKEGDRIIRTWTARDVAPMQFEDGMVAPDDVIPKLVVANERISAFVEVSEKCASIKSWEDLGHCKADLYEKQQEVTPEVKAVAEQIAKTAKTETEKVKAVWKWMNENVRYVGLEKGLGGWVPLSAHVVCTKKYGDCKAVGGLISVLCRELGLKADPIAIGTRLQLAGAPARGMQHPISQWTGDVGGSVAAAAINHDDLMASCTHWLQGCQRVTDCSGLIESRHNDGEAHPVSPCHDQCICHNPVLSTWNSRCL